MSRVRLKETPDFTSLDMWSPKSPDLNPVDYQTWVTTQ